MVKPLKRVESIPKEKIRYKNKIHIYNKYLKHTICNLSMVELGENVITKDRLHLVTCKRCLEYIDEIYKEMEQWKPNILSASNVAKHNK